jgi:hypothetical protein
LSQIFTNQVDTDLIKKSIQNKNLQSNFALISQSNMETKKDTLYIIKKIHEDDTYCHHGIKNMLSICRKQNISGSIITKIKKLVFKLCQACYVFQKSNNRKYSKLENFDLTKIFFEKIHVDIARPVFIKTRAKFLAVAVDRLIGFC